MQNKSLILDFLEWVCERQPTYAEVMGVWRTSCPRLTIWEDAVDLGLVRRMFVPGVSAKVVLKPAAVELLRQERGVLVPS